MSEFVTVFRSLLFLAAAAAADDDDSVGQKSFVCGGLCYTRTSSPCEVANDLGLNLHGVDSLFFLCFFYRRKSRRR